MLDINYEPQTLVEACLMGFLRNEAEENEELRAELKETRAILRRAQGLGNIREYA